MGRIAGILNATVILISLGGCIQDSGGESVLGESCASTGDCVLNLRCLDQVCVPNLDAGGDPDMRVANEAGVYPDGAPPRPDPDPDPDPGPKPLPEPAITSMLAIAASVDASKPLLFAAIVNVDAERRRLRVTLTALTADVERVPVGPGFVAVSELGDAGEFVLDFDRVTIDGAADPIIPGAPIEADIVLHGTLSDVLCGTVSGQIIQPAMLPLEGDFGTAPAPDEVYADLTLVSACSR